MGQYEPRHHKEYFDFVGSYRTSSDNLLSTYTLSILDRISFKEIEAWNMETLSNHIVKSDEDSISDKVEIVGVKPEPSNITHYGELFKP